MSREIMRSDTTQATASESLSSTHAGPHNSPRKTDDRTRIQALATVEVPPTRAVRTRRLPTAWNSWRAASSCLEFHAHGSLQNRMQLWIAAAFRIELAGFAGSL